MDWTGRIRGENFLNSASKSKFLSVARVYLTGRNGATIVIKQSDKIEALATNRLDDRIDASPAMAGGELFLRGRNSLYCIAEK